MRQVIEASGRFQAVRPNRNNLIFNTILPIFFAAGNVFSAGIMAKRCPFRWVSDTKAFHCLKGYTSAPGVSAAEKINNPAQFWDIYYFPGP